MAAITSTTNIKLKALMTWPLRVIAAAGLKMSRANGVITIGFDFPSLTDAAPISNPNNFTIPVYDKTLQIYKEATLDQLPTTTTGDVRTPVGDTDYNILASDRYVALTVPFTAGRTWPLPPANTVTGGIRIVVQDEVGAISNTNPLTINPSGSDTINGTTGIVLGIPHSGFEFRSDGVSKWSYREEKLYAPIGVTAAFTIDDRHHGKTIFLGGSGFYPVTVGTITRPDFRTTLVNPNTTRGRLLINGSDKPIIGMGQKVDIWNDAGTIRRSSIPRIVLKQATTFYAAGGASPSDTDNDGLASTSQFATIQHGIDYIANNVDINRQNVILQCADGTYNTPLHLYPVTGWGTIGGHSELIIRGNLATPANCKISVANSNCFSMVGLITPWRVEGFKMEVTSGVGNCILCDGGSFLYGGKNEFGVAPNAHIAVSYKSFYEAVADYSISGGAANHVNANVSSLADMVGVNVTITGTPAFSNAFVFAAELSDVTWQVSTFTGSATGARYVAVLNAVINTGTGNTSFLPGNSAGSTSSGGVYG